MCKGDKLLRNKLLVGCIILQDENNKENSFDNIGNSYYAYRKSKMKNETNYGLRISKDSINQGQSR